ncbi:MAG: AAA family ATPase, partial [Chloroflexi bacterium]|nr:AAA family ATPase [Chloroflexota bacterium]
AVEGDALLCVPGPDLWVDTWALQAALDDGRRETLEAAGQWWRGPFLDGFGVRDSLTFEDWLRLEREIWQGRALDIFGRLSASYDASGDWQAAVRAARRALAIDPLQEHLHRALMRILARSGDRAAALAQFRTCQELLQAELGADPDPDTVALADSIAHGGLPRRQPALPRDGLPAPAPSVHLARPALPLVGRDRELQLALRWLDQAADADRGQMIVLQGETGIGKSRLVEETLASLDRATGRRWSVLLGHSYEAERSLPYRAVVDALEAVVPLIDPTVLGLPDVWLHEVGRLLPDLVVRAPVIGAGPIEAAPEQYRLFEGVARFLAMLGSPLLLVLEDLHWADEATLQLLSFVLRHKSTARIVMLVTVRTEDMSDDLAAMLRSLEHEGRLQAMHLERLTSGDTAALLQAMVTEPVQALGERLHAETEGNPLFAVEMVRSLLEQGALIDGAGGAAGRLLLPDSVQAVIASRLARLDDAARGMLNAAAIFRRGATFERIRAVSGFDEDAALDALERLLQARLLRETIDRARPGADEVYLFGHDQIRQVVYDNLSAARRRILHRRAVEVVTTAEDRAYHATHGHLWEQALPWSTAAAVEATQLSGYAAATRLYLQALDCLDQLPPTPSRHQEVELRLALATVGFYVQPGALTDWLAPAESAARELGDDSLLTRIGLMQASALYIQGRFTAALPLLEDLAGSPMLAADPDLQARHTNTLGRLLMLCGELRRARDTLERALPLMEGRATPLDYMVTTEMLAAAYAYLGEFDRAQVLVEAMRARADAVDDPSLRSVSSIFRGVIAVTRGDWPSADRLLRDGIDLARATANSIYEYVGLVFLGPTQAHLGAIDDALATTRRALDLANRSGLKVLLSRAYGWLAEALVAAGEPAAAVAAAAEGQAVAAEHGWPLDGAACARSAAVASIALQRWADAEDAIARALETMQRLEALPDVARCEGVVCRLALARGDLARATAASRRAADMFERMGMVSDLAALPRLAASAD